MGLGLKPERIAANRSAVLTSGIIDLNVNMIIGFVAAYLLGFSITESLIVAAAFYISSTAMAITSLIENRKLMLREAETVIWLMVFEDLILIIFLALISAGDQNLIVFLVKILGVLGVLYALAHYGKEFLISILYRDDELPIIFTFVAVLTTASVSMYLGIPETMMVIALGVAFATTDPDAFEQHARPFKDVFLVVFFVFFGVTIDFSGGVNWFMITIICLLAIVSKLDIRCINRHIHSWIGAFGPGNLGKYDRKGGIFHCNRRTLRLTAYRNHDCSDGHRNLNRWIVCGKIQFIITKRDYAPGTKKIPAAPGASGPLIIIRAAQARSSGYRNA